MQSREFSIPQGAMSQAADSGHGAIDLFVVETPLQLLNAVEAKQFFRSQRSMLLIIVREAFPRAHFERILDSLLSADWSEVRFVRMKARFRKISGSPRPGSLGSKLSDKYGEIHQLLNRKRLESVLRSIPAGARIFLGNYLDTSKSHFRHIANFLNASRVVLLDDGTDAIVVNEQRIARGKADNSQASSKVGLHVPWYARLKARVRHRHVDWDDRHGQSVTFFSAYALATAERDQLIQNEYRFLRSRRPAQRVGEEVYVLGQCLAEDGYVVLSQYVADIADLCRVFAGSPIVYVPHPRETSETIARVVRATGVEVRRYPVPIECALLSAPELPKIVASLFCSALVNCSVIFGDCLRSVAYRMDLDTLLSNRKEVSQVYAKMSLMQSSTFQVLDRTVRPVPTGQREARPA
jgi:hypothetical protein